MKSSDKTQPDRSAIKKTPGAHSTRRLEAMQAKIREAEDRFQVIFDNSPDGMVIINPTENAEGPWLIECCNKSFCEMNGFDQSELIGKDIRVVSDETATEVELPNKFHEKINGEPSEGMIHRRGYYQRLKQGPIRIEEIHKRKDGSTFQIQASSCLVTLGGQERVLGIDRDITERKRNEEQIQILSKFPMENPYPVMRIAPDGMLLYANKSSEPLLAMWNIGIGQAIPKDWQTWNVEVFSSRQNKEVEIECGEQVFSCVLAPIVDAGYVNVYGRDITGHKRAEEKLLASEESYRRLFEAAQDGILILDAETGVIEDVNPFLIEMLGFSSKELVGANIWELGFFKDIAANKANFRELQQEKYVRYEDLPLETASGRRFDVEFISNVYQVDHRKVIQCNIRDITERARTEKALAWERYLINTLLDNIPDFIYFKDIQSRFIRTTKALARAFGLHDPADLVGKTDFDFFAREHAQTAFEEEQKIIQTGQPMIGVIEKETWPDHADTWASTTKMPLRDEKGDIVGTFGISREITEIKQAQEALVRQAEELRLRNAELGRLYRATGSLLSSTPFDMQAMARTIAEVVVQDFGQANCNVFLIRKESNELNRVAVAGLYADQVNKIVLTVDGGGQVPQAIRDGQVINTADVHANPAYLPSWEAARAELTIPLKVGDHVIGAIDVQSAEPGAFKPDDERLMSIFAERAALVLERGRLNEELERRLLQLTSLRTIDMAISSSMDMNLTLGILLDQLTKHLSVDAADVLLVDPRLQTFKYAAEQGFHTQARLNTTLRIGDAIAAQALREQQTIMVQNLGNRLPELQRSDQSSSEGFVTYVGTPLIAKGQVKGVLEIFQRSPFELNQEQYTFLEMLAGQAAIAIDSAQLFENLQNSNFELMMAYDETIEGWSRAMDLRDKETEGHTQRVTELTLRLAASMGLGAEEQAHIRRGALLHDIGKMGVPDDILRKPGALSEEEWVIMRQHPQLAYDMLVPIIYLRPAIDIPYCHHEKWDGTGYPRGLKDMQIPLAARIFAVVDVWDALSSDRPYQKAWPEDKVRQYIREQAGIHFDPHIVEIFLKMVPGAE